jgi:hypothetical protein
MDTPKIPTLKDSQKPQLKIRGLGVGLTLVERLKQFKKKDLAFILAGLGTLFMAPLAEHFMMTPESGDGQLQQGWGKGTGSNIFGGGGSPYETGNNGIAQGGAIGGGGDIITPLNVRDPSSLVLGPGAAQQPPAGSIAPPAPPTRSDADMKDALAGAASRGGSSASGRAPLPIPKASLGNSGLRGLGVAGGGSSSSSGPLGPISAAGGAGGAGGTGGGGLNLIRSAPNYKGAAGARGGGNPTGLDATRRAGQNAGDAFSRGGSALSNLNEAAKETIPTGGSSYGGHGQGGFGPNDKGFGGNGPGGSKSIGESLAFIQAKERMMQDLQLAFEKRKLKDADLLLYGIRNDAVKTMGTELSKYFAEFVVGSLKKLTVKDGSYIVCKSPAPPKTPVSAARPCKDAANGTRCWRVGEDGKSYSYVFERDQVIPCDVFDDDGNPNPAKSPETSIGEMPAGIGITPQMLGSVDKLCDSIRGIQKGTTESQDGTKMDRDADTENHYKEMWEQADKLLTVRNTLAGGNSESCGKPRMTGTVAGHQGKIKDLLTKETEGDSPGAAAALLRAVDKQANQEGKKSVQSAADSINAAGNLLRDVKSMLDDSKQTLAGIQRFSVQNMHRGDGRMPKLMDEANALKEKLKDLQAAQENRQRELNDAKTDLEAAAVGQDALAFQLLEVNSDIVKLNEKKKIKLEVKPAQGVSAVHPQDVSVAITKAREALNEACGVGENACSKPEEPAGEGTPAADPQKDAQLQAAAAEAVGKARDSESSYLQKIIMSLESKQPSGSSVAQGQ